MSMTSELIKELLGSNCDHTITITSVMGDQVHQHADMSMVVRFEAIYSVDETIMKEVLVRKHQQMCEELNAMTETAETIKKVFEAVAKTDIIGIMAITDNGWGRFSIHTLGGAEYEVVITRL